MKKRLIWLIVTAACVLAGCVNLTNSPSLGENNPANPSAPTHDATPATPYLMAATNLAARHLDDLPRVDSSAHEHDAHKAHAGHATGAATNQAPAQAPTYTCPHHPEVKQNKPGECPKCGMNLEVKK